MAAILREDWVELRPGRKCYILQCSAQSPITLFFVHGAGGRSEQWREQIKFFQNKYNLLAFDFLGLGKSDKPKPTHSDPVIYSFHEFSTDLQIIFDRYRTEQNIILGHSYGGALAAYLVAHNSSTIQKLVLSSPLPLLSKFKISKLFNLPSFILEWLQPHLTKIFMRLAYQPYANRELMANEITAANRNKMYVIRALTRAMQHIPQIDLKQIQQPCLVLLSKDDRVISAQQSFEYYRQLPHVEFKYITQARHMLILEQPDVVNYYIQEFIEK